MDRYGFAPYWVSCPLFSRSFLPSVCGTVRTRSASPILPLSNYCHTDCSSANYGQYNRQLRVGLCLLRRKAKKFCAFYKPPLQARLVLHHKFLPSHYPLPHEYRNHVFFSSPRIKFFTDVLCEFSTIRFRWIFQQYTTPLLGHPNSVCFLLYFLALTLPYAIVCMIQI